jgi:hypothetical protein
MLAAHRLASGHRRPCEHRPDFLLGAAGKARSLRFFRPEITRKLFAIQARMERQLQALRHRPCDPHRERTELVGTRISAAPALEAEAPPHVCAWGGAVAPTSHSRTPVMTTRGEVVLSA